MAAMTLKKVMAPTAAEICGRFPLAGAAATATHLPPAEFLAHLVDRRLFQDATRFLAHALPKREAVWWACICSRPVCASDAPTEVIAALEAAEAWVYRPTEDNRRAAMAAAEATRFSNAAGWAAVAAFWSGGSMAPSDAPIVPPGEGLTAAAVAGAVLLAAVQHEPEKSDDKFRAFIAAAVDIANGGSGRGDASGRDS
ncbi:MAG: hypothetical protein JWL84_2294 [Rhodospirillales bacterium]|jgi:hypothetical protein|nr:hypothetical protein [Rhodospirillales bacterium]